MGEQTTTDTTTAGATISGSLDEQDRYVPRFTLSPEELEATRIKFAKINQRAIKRGFTGRLTLDVEGPRTTSVTNAAGLPVTIVVYDVTITGQAPSYDGWRLLAVLDFDEHAGLITRCAPGVDTIDRTGLRAGWCDHCGRTRTRNKTYLVGNDVGQQKQVGSSCIKDFLGHSASVVFYSEESVSDDLFGDMMGGPRDHAFATDTVLGAAWACIKTFGWEPASSYGVSTRARVHAVLQPSCPADRELAEAITPLIPEMAGKAAEVRAFVTSDDFAGGSEYVRNLKAIISADHVSSRNFGLLVSAPQAWARHQDQTLRRAAERTAAAASTHVGEVGSIVEREMTLTAINYISGNYGTTSLYTFVDEDGNVFKWFSSSPVLEDREGEKLMIRGTVKEHDEYRGAKQTVLTRCKEMTFIDRLGKQIVISSSRVRHEIASSVDGHCAADMLRRDTDSWTTTRGGDDFIKVIVWLEGYLDGAGELSTTQRVWNQHGEILGLQITRTAAGKVHAKACLLADEVRP